MEIKIVNPKGEPVEASEVPVTPSVVTTSGSQPDDSYQRAVGQVLGLENDGDFNKYQPQLKTLVDYAKTQTTDHSPENLKWIIRSLEVKLGTPPFAEDRIKFVTRYAYLLAEERRIKDERKKFEGL